MCAWSWERFISIIKIIGVPQNVVCSHPAPVSGNEHDVPDVWPINTPSDKYVRDGGRLGSKVVDCLNYNPLRRTYLKSKHNIPNVVSFQMSSRLYGTLMWSTDSILTILKTPWIRRDPLFSVYTSEEFVHNVGMHLFV